MTRSNEPDNRDRGMQRQLRSLNRKVDRLEYSQISPQEFSRAFDRVYDDMDALDDTINERFDRLEGEVRELNQKFDIVMQYITEQGETKRTTYNDLTVKCR